MKYNHWMGCGAALWALLMMAACSKGDYLGPAERTARAAFRGWDMWATASVRPYETPMPASVPMAVPFTGLPAFDQASKAFLGLDAQTQDQRGELVYRRFCHHCHGRNGDGRIIVGESFGFHLPDLRADVVQTKSDEELFWFVHDGSQLMIPLRHTVSPQDIVAALHQVRRIRDHESTPFFKPQFTEPIQ